METNQEPPKGLRFTKGLALWPLLVVPIFWGASGTPKLDTVPGYPDFGGLFGACAVVLGLPCWGLGYGFYATHKEAASRWYAMPIAAFLFTLLGVCYILLSIFLVWPMVSYARTHEGMGEAVATALHGLFWLMTAVPIGLGLLWGLRRLPAFRNPSDASLDEEVKPPAVSPENKPTAVILFQAYAWIMIGQGLVALCVWLLITSSDDFHGSPLLFCMAGFAGITVVASIFSIRLRPKPWVWKFDMALICFGILGGLIAPLSIVLLYFWFQPETRRYFKR